MNTTKIALSLTALGGLSMIYFTTMYYSQKNKKNPNIVGFGKTSKEAPLDMRPVLDLREGKN